MSMTPAYNTGVAYPGEVVDIYKGKSVIFLKKLLMKNIRVLLSNILYNQKIAP